MKKTKWLWMALVAAVVMAQAVPAKALNREWAAALGFVGGVLVADAFNNHCSPPPPPPRCERPVFVERPVVIEQPVYIDRPVYRERTVVIREPVCTGRYEYQTRREWVPGHWVYERSRHGRRCRVWAPGYYRTVQVRVWVEDEGCWE